MRGSGDNVDQAILSDILDALGLPSETDHLRMTGVERLGSCFAVTALAAASIAAAGAAVAELDGVEAKRQDVEVDSRSAALWFGWSIAPIGWEMPPPWDTIAGDYRTRDSWIKLHTNAPHHRAAVLSVLSCEATRESVAAVVSGWQGEALESAVIEAGGCAAKLRSTDDWTAHPQGKAVAGEPLVNWQQTESTTSHPWRPTPGRPLAGLRVLDLTRVLAGPVATRFLAGYGAQVLRIDPPTWDEPGVIPEVSLGKRCARLDLQDQRGRDTFLRLLAGADVLIHGYRSDALDRLHLDDATRQTARPGIIDISLDAYGHHGPWAARRGFDSLVQFSTGIAEAGMRWRRSESPVSLPVQALDHATGYFLAAAAVRAVTARLTQSGPTQARLSLARTAKLLIDHRGEATEGTVAVDDADFAETMEHTDWGPARRLKPPVSVHGSPMRWDRPASKLGSSEPRWE